MKEIFSEWLINIGVFSIISSLTMKFLPGKAYVPYIKLFIGIVTILIFLNPLLKIAGVEKMVADDLTKEVFEIEMNQMETELIHVEEEQKKELEEQYKKWLKENQIDE